MLFSPSNSLFFISKKLDFLLFREYKELIIRCGTFEGGTATLI